MPFRKRVDVRSVPVRQGETRSLAFLNGIPIFERFFLGGEYDIRGYNIRSITPVVVSDVYHSNRGAITAQKQDPSDPTKLIEITDPNELRKFSFQAPEGACAGLNAPDISGKNCNTVRFDRILTPIGGDTQFIYNIEYRVPIVSVLSIAAFADIGAVFNARKYKDQITSSNFIPNALTGTVHDRMPVTLHRDSYNLAQQMRRYPVSSRLSRVPVLNEPPPPRR